MRRLSIALCCAFLIAGTTSVYARPQDQPPQGDKKTSPMKTAKPMVTTGTVKTYEAGKSIAIDAKKGPKTYDLTSTDMTVTVSPDVKVWSKVKVTEKTDVTGRKTITIEASGGGTN